MEEKGKTAKIALIIIFFVVLAALAAAFILLKMRGKPVQLSRNKMEQLMSEKESVQNSGSGEFSEKEIYVEDVAPFETGSSKNNVSKQDGSDKTDNSSGYLCDYSSDRLLTSADVESLKQTIIESLLDGRDAVQMIINEMYAKYGYQFKNEKIQQYFVNKEWYQQISTRNSDMDSIYNNMTKTEQQNVKF